MRENSIDRLTGIFAVLVAHIIKKSGLEYLPNNISIADAARAARLSEIIVTEYGEGDEEGGLVEMQGARKLLCLVGGEADLEFRFGKGEIDIAFTDLPLPKKVGHNGVSITYGQGI